MQSVRCFVISHDEIPKLAPASPCEQASAKIATEVIEKKHTRVSMWAGSVKSQSGLRSVMLYRPWIWTMAGGRLPPPVHLSTSFLFHLLALLRLHAGLSLLATSVYHVST